jgi:hypothetical protein
MSLRHCFCRLFAPAPGWMLVALLAFGITPALALDGGAVEYRVKAAYLYNFTKFVEWPPDVFGHGSSPFVIGVLDPEGRAASAIAEALAGKTTGSGRPLEVRVLSSLHDGAAECHQIFVTRAAGITPDQVQGQLALRGILLVGEADGFAARGGAIGLVLSGDAVRCEINLAAAERSGLRLSGRLASVSRIVRELPRR